jgi:hypothetical protein
VFSYIRQIEKYEDMVNITGFIGLEIKMYVVSSLTVPSVSMTELLNKMNDYFENRQGTLFQAYEVAMAIQLRLAASFERSNSKGKVTLILALVRICSSGVIENM